MGYVFTGLMEAVGASHKVFKLIDRQPEFRCDGHFAPDSLKPTIEFRDVHFCYPSRKDTPVLKVSRIPIFFLLIFLLLLTADF